jgi:hypothetical protein
VNSQAEIATHFECVAERHAPYAWTGVRYLVGCVPPCRTALEYVPYRWNNKVPPSPPTQPTFDIHGYHFTYHHSRDALSIYQSPEAYLRIGQRDAVEHELHRHILWLKLGFPLPELLAQGEHGAWFYAIEASAGEIVFGEIFEQEYQQRRQISDATFQAYLTLVCRFAESQLQTQIDEDIRDEFADLVRLEGVLAELPHLRDDTLAAFDRAATRLQRFPAVHSHGDFHPYNVCPGGVIDLDRAGRGYAGYDVITGLLMDDLFAPDDQDYQYSDSQRQQYLGSIDALFAAQGLPIPSAYVDDFLFCKLLSLVPGRHNRPQQQRWFYESYATRLARYLNMASE